MEFEFSDSVYVSEDDMDYMTKAVKMRINQEHFTPEYELTLIQDVINDWASGLDDCDFYLIGHIEEDLAEELRKRSKPNINDWYSPNTK